MFSHCRLHIRRMYYSMNVSFVANFGYLVIPYSVHTL